MSHHIMLGPLALPRPSALSKGRAAPGLLLAAVPQDGQGWVPTTPGLGSSQHASPWNYFPGRLQKHRDVLLMQPEIQRLQHRVK